MAKIIDLVKWDGDSTVLAYKYPSENLSTTTQLIVNETQEAFVVHSGVYDGPFAGGHHILDTENLPLLRGAIGMPFGKKSPFTAEVWFVNRIINMAIPWGTSDPIQLQDPKYNMMVPIRAFGQYGVQIKDSKKFLLKLVGTLKSFNSEALSKYFAGVFGTRIKQAIAEAIIDRKISVLETSMHLEEISALLQSSLEIDMYEYGIRLTNFNIRSINLPENDPAVIQLKSALAKKAELGILGMSYQQDRSFNVLQTAAGNEGTAGNMVGTGLGLGIGVGIGGGAAQALTNNIGTEENGSMQNLDYGERIRLLKEAGDMRESGILNEDEFSLFKAQILRENR